MTVADESKPKRGLPPGAKPITDSDRARELNAKSLRVRQAKAEARIQARRGATRLRPLSEAEWQDLYLSPAFDEDWRRYLYRTKLDLDRHYAPNKAEAPQYAAMAWRLAVMMTLAAMLDVETGQSKVPRPTLFDERMKVEQRILAYVAQLQRYTESETHIEIVRSDERTRALETVVMIAERVLSAVERARFAEALMSVLERGAGADPARIAALLPAGGTDVIEHAAKE